MQSVKHTSLDFQKDKLVGRIFVYAIILICSVYLGHKNFLIYHTIVELICIIIAFVMAIISINTYKVNGNNRIIFLGIAFGFIGCFDLIHLLTYQVMDVFAQHSFNLSIQLWMVARYMESISFLISFILPCEKFNIKQVFLIYLVVSAFLLFFILYLNVFPDCYIENIGFTSFKLISEYIICGILLVGAFYSIRKKRSNLIKSDIFIVFSLIIMIISEIFFANYINVYGFLSVLGHGLKLISFCFIYVALIKSSLQDPHYSLIELNNLLQTKNQNLGNLVSQLKLEYEEREKLENEKLKKKEILKAILESSADGILVINKDRKVIHVNSKFMKMVNLPYEITSHTNNDELIEFIKNQIYNPEEFESAIEEEWESDVEYTHYVYLKSGKVYEIHSFPFIDKNVIKGKVISYRDITDKIKIEQLQMQAEVRQVLFEKAKEFDELKTNFFCTVSHEIKTPLNIILGVIQLLSNRNETKEDSSKFSCSRYIKMMKQNCYRLINLANNLIDITKIDSGFMDMKFKNHNIVYIIEDITLSVAEYTKSKGITLIFDTDIEEKILACDADQLERVMLNLLSNAVKFTKSGGLIEVNIKDKEEFIIITVKDNGIGIPENMVEIIFDRFRQVDSSLRRQKEGSGIGLSIVKSIIEMHGGKISLNSEIDKGSEFIIELPVCLVEDDNQIYISKEINVERINIEFSDIYELNNFN